MREMKDSGIEWIGDIPKEWTIRTIGRLFTAKAGGDANPCFYSDESDEKHPYPVYTNTLDKNQVYAYTSTPEFPANTITVTGRGDIGHAIYRNVPYDAIIRLNVLIPKFNLDQKYYAYFIDTVVPFFTNSAAIGQLSANQIISYKVCFLPVEEQKDISNYLDKKCSEIDSLTADIQKQIETLEEYKRSVITEAVTKGFDSDVEMRDSGIAWIGEIPKHWTTEKVKFHLERKEPRNPGNVQVLSVYREYGVIPKDSRDDNHNITSEDTSNYKYVVPDNLVINKMKAWQGSMGISDYEGIVSPAYFVYRFIDETIIPKYLHYLFRSCYKDEFRRISGGIREGQWDLSPIEFANTLLLIPPKDEQQLIIEHIDGIIVEIDSIIADRKQQIETIEEYKKSLIFEYVTGKKEVSNG